MISGRNLRSMKDVCESVDVYSPLVLCTPDSSDGKEVSCPIEETVVIRSMSLTIHDRPPFFPFT